MYKLFTILFAVSLSAVATAQEYGGERNPYGFRPYIAITGGQGSFDLEQSYITNEEDDDGNVSEVEYLALKNSGREAWTGFTLGADFINYPVELVLSYGNIGAGQSDAVDFVEENLSTGEETLVERYEASQDYDLNALSLTGKIDLSWNCQAACLYVLAGYSYGELDWQLSINEVVEEEFSLSESKTLSKGFVHFGAGFRYDFTDHLRLNAEYVRYNVGVIGDIDVAAGEKVEFDVGKLPVWQAGMTYIF